MKTKTHFKWLFITMIVPVLFFVACEKEEFPEKANDEKTTELNTFSGRQLKNPYSVTNMRIAYNSLNEKYKSKGNTNEKIGSEDDIKATDFYVKIFIQNADQLERLEADSLNLSILPLDQEILEEGSLEIDEKTLDEEGYWLYTAVPVNYQMARQVKHEILEELFLPETEDENSRERSEYLKSKFSLSFLDELEDESLRLTGNLEEEDTNDTIQYRRPKRRPQGYIKVQNTTTGTTDPVIGVKVKVRRWFKWGRGYTDNNGFYSVNNTFRRDVNYKVVFKNSRGFKIWPSLISISSARYSAGKHGSGERNITFNTNSKGWRFSTVNNAAVHYNNYCTQFGIEKPHSNLRIVAQDKTGSSSAPMLRRVWGKVGFTTNSQLVTFLSKANGITVAANSLWIITKLVLPDVIIKAAPSQGTARVFEATFHELAHTSHFKQVGSSYWIRYINYIITYGSYGDGHGMNSGVAAVGEMWAYHMGQFLALQHFGNNNNNPVILPAAMENFTPFPRPDSRDIKRNRINGVIINLEGWIPVGIIHDLMDNNADVIRPGFTDNVSGYTLSQIFGALQPNVQTPQAFRNRLLSNNGNWQQTQVNQLFEAYYYH